MFHTLSTVELYFLVQWDEKDQEDGNSLYDVLPSKDIVCDDPLSVVEGQEVSALFRKKATLSKLLDKVRHFVCVHTPLSLFLSLSLFLCVCVYLYLCEEALYTHRYMYMLPCLGPWVSL